MVHRVLRAFPAVQTYAVSDAPVAQWVFALFIEVDVFRLFQNNRTLLRGVLTNTKAVARFRVLQSAPITTEALLLFHGVSYVHGGL